MKIQVENGYIKGFAIMGDISDGITVSDDFIEKIDTEKLGYFKYVEGKDPIYDAEKFKADELEKRKSDLVIQREVECFPIINRGKIWYDGLTAAQLSELNTWYQAWLNVTEIMIVPEKPSWI